MNRFYKLVIIAIISSSFLYPDLSLANSPQSETSTMIDTIFWVGVGILTVNIFFDFFPMKFSPYFPKDNEYPETYLFSNKQLDEFCQLEGVGAKVEFIDQFWKSEVFEDSISGNQFRLEFRRRVQLANQQFIEINCQGWQTDRGRVLILYGEPDEVYHVHMYKNSEVWGYFRPAGSNTIPEIFIDIIPQNMNFIFAENNNYGNYDQVFSTESGEVIDPQLYEYKHSNPNIEENGNSAY